MTILPSDAIAPGAVPAISRGDLIEMYRRMYQIRGFEERAGNLYRSGKIPGFVHLAIGQEASAVGACYHLRRDDVITSTHRGHGHALAKGLEPREMFAELMGKETGVCRGRGGSMHIADPRRGIYGANGIVGAGIPIALGAATAARLRGSDAVAVAFLGDGAISTGAFHEATNVAALKELPLILVCENNGFSEFSTFADQHPVDLETRASGYGLRYVNVDGNDISAMSRTMREVIEQTRIGGRPFFVEARTLRIGGHYDGDPQLYRRDSDAPVVPDPLDVACEQLRALGVTDEVLAEIRRIVDEELDKAVAEALDDPTPQPGDLDRGLLVPRSRVPHVVVEPVPANEPGRPQWKFFEAIKEALRGELIDDDDVFLAGIDIGKGGNVFGITRGLAEEWPSRLIDTPIAESAIVGIANGAALAGLKPVVEVMYFDFIGVCLDQIMNQAAKLRYMTGGQISLALTIRTQFGAGRSSGAQHSQSLEAILAHIPGLTVVMPSTPADAYGLLRTAIQDPNPVVFVENRLLYGMKGHRCDPDHRVPIGQAAIRRPGQHLTMVTYSRMVHVCLEAAEELAGEGIDCEIIDLRTVAPLDVTAVLTSVEKTGRLMIVHEANEHFGVGAEIAARIADLAVWHLDAPIIRVGARPVPAPYSPVLERAWLPQTSDVVEAARKLARI